MLVSRGREPWLIGLALALASLRCTPDFDSLSSGDGSGGAGAHAGGSDGVGGSEDLGGSDGMMSGSGANVGGTSTGGVAGSTSSTGGGDSEAGSTTGGSPAEGGEAGAGGSAPSCVWKGGSHFADDGFDGGLDGHGFDIGMTLSSMTSTHGATAFSEWDEAVGHTCAGSLHLQGAFTSYASDQEPDEVATADFRFANADWTGANKLHAWIRVSPVNAAITGVQFFVLSGSSFLYKSVFDDTSFVSGEWHELVMLLAPGTSYDPKDVRRLGVKIVLRRDGAANTPPQAPTVDVWLDDIWVE